MGFIFDPSVYLFKPPAALFLIRSVQKIRMVFVERVSAVLGKRETFSFVVVHLFSRLIVANCTIGLSKEVSTQAQLDVLVVDWLPQGGQEAEPWGELGVHRTR